MDNSNRILHFVWLNLKPKGQGQGQGQGQKSQDQGQGQKIWPRGQGQGLTSLIFLGYRSRILTLNPNPITDPNPNSKINPKQNDTGMKLNIELYLK